MQAHRLLERPLMQPNPSSARARTFLVPPLVAGNSDLLEQIGFEQNPIQLHPQNGVLESIVPHEKNSTRVDWCTWVVLPGFYSLRIDKIEDPRLGQTLQQFNDN